MLGVRKSSSTQMQSFIIAYRETRKLKCGQRACVVHHVHSDRAHSHGCSATHLPCSSVIRLVDDAELRSKPEGQL